MGLLIYQDCTLGLKNPDEMYERHFPHAEFELVDEIYD